MSRSLNTQKLKERALRRLVRPHGKRREDGDRLSGRRRGNAVHVRQRLPISIQKSASVGEQASSEGAVPLRLAITKQKPLPGTHYPITLQDIRDLLAALGPVSTYGLKSVRLRQEGAVRREGIVFAEYGLSGDITLFALPASPWWLPFLLTAEDSASFERYGAHIEADSRLETTTVAWSPDGLRQFTLYEVLAHELGHHLLQRTRGTKAKVCRHGDHERRADLQTRRNRRLSQRGTEI